MTIDQAIKFLKKMKAIGRSQKSQKLLDEIGHIEIHYGDDLIIKYQPKENK